MGKKRSSRITKDKGNAESKSKERKKIFDIVESLTYREHDNHFNTDETDNTLETLKSNPKAIPNLRAIARTEDYHIRVRIKALEILQDLGESMDEDSLINLRDAETLINEIRVLLREQGGVLPPAISDHLCGLGDKLKKAVIDQIIEEEGETSFSFLSLITGQDEMLDQIIAGSLAHVPLHKSAELLEKMGSETENKKLRKSIKKSLFILRERGIHVEERKSKDSQASILRPPTRMSEGHLSAIDGFGDRLVWLAEPRFPTGFNFFEVLMNDEEGLKQFHGMEITKKMHSEFIQSLSEESPVPLVDADPSYCGFLVEEAYATAKNGGYPVPDEYLQWKDRIRGAGGEKQRPLIYAFFEEGEIKTDETLVMSPETMFDLPEFMNWTIPIEDLEKYSEMVQEARRSRLILSTFQKEERISGVLTDAVQELFQGERGLLYKRRFEEMAYVLYKLDYEHEAKVCLKLALTIEDTDLSSFSFPFLLELVKRSLLSVLHEEEERERETPSVLFKP